MTGISLRILAGVLGLYRFVVADLVSTSMASASAVSTWLDDVPRSCFDRAGMTLSKRGRPRTVWHVTERGHQHLGDALGAALGSDARIAAGSEHDHLGALDRAEDLMATACDGDTAEDRASALACVVFWRGTAKRLLDHPACILGSTGQDPRERLDLLRGRVGHLACSGN